MKNNLTILALDTALSGMSIAVTTAEGKKAHRQIITAREQAALLIPVVQEVLAEGQCIFQDIDLIVTTIGPGSFTGVRIGMTAAKSLAMAINCPVVGLSTLDVMARHYNTDQSLLCVLETKRNDFYAAYYNAQRTLIGQPMALSSVDILNCAPIHDFDIGGDCLVRFQKESGQNHSFLDTIKMINPIILAQMGGEKYIRQQSGDILKPLYLRGADVSQPKNKPRQLPQDALDQLIF